MTSLGKNAWGQLKAGTPSPTSTDAPPAKSALIDLAPPPRPPAPTPTPPSVQSPPPNPSTGELTRPRPEPRASASTRPRAERKPRKASVAPTDEFTETSVYVSRSVAEAFRDAASRRSMLMNALIVVLAREHGAALERQAKAAGRQPVRRRSAERVVDPMRKVMTFTIDELELLDKLAARCNWPRSRVVSELMKLA